MVDDVPVEDAPVQHLARHHAVGRLVVGETGAHERKHPQAEADGQQQEPASRPGFHADRAVD